MSDLDVSLRLRLVNQLSRPAGEAERDLRQLDDAARKLGRASGGDQLARDLGKVGDKAADAKRRLGEVEGEAQRLRQALGRVGDGRGSTPSVPMPTRRSKSLDS